MFYSVIRLVEVFPGLRAVRIADADGLDTEVYILECDGGLILVDVGFTPECHRNIQVELDIMGKKWEDIKMIKVNMTLNVSWNGIFRPIPVYHGLGIEFVFP